VALELAPDSKQETAMPRPILSRRTFLRGTSVALALPLLDAMKIGSSALAVGDPTIAPRRMVAICTALGLHEPFLFPKEAGRDYTLTPYLEIFGELRKDLTVFSGLSHPDVTRDHITEASFLTGAPNPGNSSFKNTISLDQFAAERLGNATRFPSLTLNTANNGLSWTRSGARIPADSQPSKVFARLFLDGTSEEVGAQVRRLRDGQSVMDRVASHARAMERGLPRGDRAKLEEYFNSVREVEKRLVQGQEWAKTPKPKVAAEPPRDIPSPADMVGRTQLMYDLIYLALQTDSTRLITLFITGMSVVPPIEGVSLDWHSLSHHGNDPRKIEQLAIIEKAEMHLLHALLAKLKETAERGANLLDRTMVLFGSNLGNASSHDGRNLPILLAGGGFKHGQHLAFDPNNSPPLGNLFVSMLQQLGLDVETFSTGTGPIQGLEPA
jgi:hypothetical protein